MGKMKFNIEKLKSFFFLSIVALSLSVSAISVQAAEQMQESEVEQILSGQDDSVVTGVEISATTMMYAVTKVNVRKEPNTSSGILGKLEPGDNIFAVELTDEGWYRVVYAGETGYVRGDFLAVFGDVDEWAASEPEPEPEPEPIEEPDITETTEDDKDAQEVDNVEEIEEAESKEEESDNAAEQEEQPAGKINIFTILIIVVLIVVIFVYAAIQIINENKNPDESQENNDKDESDEDGEWDDDEDESDEDNEWEDNEDELGEDDEWGDGEHESDEDDDGEDEESDNNEPEEEMDLEITDLDD